MFSQVIPLLSIEMLRTLRHILLDKSATDRYKSTKAFLLQEFDLSDKMRLEKLLSTSNSLNRKPSFILRDLQELVSPGLRQDPLIKELWFRRLPVCTRAFLEGSRLTNLPEMAEVVDAYHSRLPRESVPASSCTCSSAKDNETISLSAAVNELSIAQTQESVVEPVTIAAVRDEMVIRSPPTELNRSQSSNLFFIRDRQTDTQILVDTGAEISVIPVALSTASTKPNLSSVQLQAANESTILNYGQQLISLDLALCKEFLATPR